jgi:hypothetical protein
MATLKQDIKKQSDWIIKAFQADGLRLDYSIKSLIEIDKFFEKHSKNGKPVRGGRLSQNLGPIIFSIGSYIGETFIKNAKGTEWITDDNDAQGEITASIKFPNGTECWPMQRTMKRFKNGFEDSVYTYGYELTKEYITEPFDQSFWTINKEENTNKKPWWRFW